MAGFSQTGPAHAGSIRIGCITALTGPQETLGRPILDGAQIAVNEINVAGGALGRPIEIVEADSRADPRRCIDLAHEMASKGINLFCGCITSDEALALTETMVPLGAALITCSAQSDRLTHEAFNPHFFRVTDQNIMRNRAQARLMAERYPDIKRWGAILPDSECGRSVWAAFRDGLCSAYHEIAKREPVLNAPTFAHPGETEFGPQIRTLRKNGSDGLLVATYGESGMSFYRQANRSKLFDRTTAIVDFSNEFLVPLELGSSTPEHLWLCVTWYFGGYRNLEASRRLYDEYLHLTGNGLPYGLVSAGHAAVHAYAKAIGVAQNATTAAVVAGLSGLTLNTAKGPLTFRKEDHQAICDVNLVRIRGSSTPATMDVIYNSRSDFEIAEFVRYDGARVIEPPTPGKKATHHT